jgi:hypothetical protein
MANGETTILHDEQGAHQTNPHHACFSAICNKPRFQFKLTTPEIAMNISGLKGERSPGRRLILYRVDRLDRKPCMIYEINGGCGVGRSE